MESIEVAADDVLCGKGYELVLFLFTDILLVAKRKGASKIGGMMRSPSTASLAANQAPLQTKVTTTTYLVPVFPIRIHLIRILIQHFRLNTDPIPTKNWKKFTAENFFIYFFIKNCNLLIPMPL
jgi:hypothetical protein